MLGLYLDEDSMTAAVVQGLRAGGVDTVTTQDLQRQGTADEDQLMFATDQNRVLFTQNAGHYRRLHVAGLNSGRHHTGIVVMVDQRTAVGIQIRALVRLCAELSPDGMRDRLEYLRAWCPR